MVNKSFEDFHRKAFEQLEQIKNNSRRTEFDRRHAESYDQDVQQSQSSKPMTDLSRQEVEAKLAQNKAEVDARLANFDASIKTGFAELRAEFADLRAEMAKQSGDMRTEMANVRADAHKGTTEVTRWVVGFGITILGTVLAILGAVVSFSKISERPTAAPVPAAQPGAIVITVPGATVAPAAPQAPAKQ